MTVTAAGFNEKRTCERSSHEHARVGQSRHIQRQDAVAVGQEHGCLRGGLASQRPMRGGVDDARRYVERPKGMVFVEFARTEPCQQHSLRGGVELRLLQRAIRDRPVPVLDRVLRGIACTVNIYTSVLVSTSVVLV